LKPVTAMSSASPSVAMVAALTFSGCAWSAGGGFAEIKPTSALTVKLAMSKGRIDNSGRWITNNGYAITFDGGAIAFATASVALIGGSSGSGGIAFSPARPPAGYSLCHAGHCHRTDGALIPYAEVEADLIRGAGGVATRSVAALVWDFAGTAVKPAQDTARSLTGCTPSCFLPRGTVAGADLTLTALTAAGTAEALPGSPALSSGKLAWTLGLKDPLTFRGNVIQAIDRDNSAAFKLDGTLALSDKLFDGIDWAAFASAPRIAVESSPAALTAVKTNLAQSKWTPSLKAHN